MALKITTSSESITVDNIIVAIYGQPGIGKTSLAFTAESPLLIDFDAGAHRARGRKDIVQVKSWQDVANISGDDLKGYKTLVVDTTGRALDFLTADIVKRDPALGRGGVLSQRGWGRLKTEFVAWLNLVRSFGLDIVLIAHGTEKIENDSTIVRLDVSGGSKDEVYKVADLMGRIYVSGGKRMINFDPSEIAYGKNPAEFVPMEIPSTDFGFLGSIISQCKDKINGKAEEQKKEFEEIEVFQKSCEALETPEELTDIIPVAKGKGTSFSAVLMGVAKKKGFAYEKQSKSFKKGA